MFSWRVALTEPPAANPLADARARAIRPGDLYDGVEGAGRAAPVENGARTLSAILASGAVHGAALAATLMLASAGGLAPPNEIPVEIVVEAPAAPPPAEEAPAPENMAALAPEQERKREAPPEAAAQNVRQDSAQERPQEIQQDIQHDSPPSLQQALPQDATQDSPKDVLVANLDSPQPERAPPPAPVLEAAPSRLDAQPTADAQRAQAAREKARAEARKREARLEQARRVRAEAAAEESRERVEAARARRRQAAEAAPAPPAPVRLAARVPIGAGGVRDSFDPGAYRAIVARAVSAAVGSTCPSAGAGRVVVALAIGANGRISAASLTQASGNAALDSAALSAVRRAGPFPPPSGRAGVRVPVAVSCR